MRDAALDYAPGEPALCGRVVFWNTVADARRRGICLERKIARQASAPSWLPWSSLIAFCVLAPPRWPASLAAIAPDAAPSGWSPHCSSRASCRSWATAGIARRSTRSSSCSAAAFVVSLLDRVRTRDAKRALEIPV